MTMWVNKSIFIELWLKILLECLCLEFENFDTINSKNNFQTSSFAHKSFIGEI